MVLFKRKPVQYLPQPTIEDESSEIWVIAETNEVFTTYESFLHRRDFYKQRRFICEITGHSGLTFFEALQSEMTESRELNSAFPDALKEPILRRVQFSTVSRVDHLVDEIYEEFKQDFYPGEHVATVLKDNTRLHGIIRDKMNFPRQYYTDGGVKSEAYARYLVRIVDRPNEEALLDQDHITRDRKTFSKQMLRAFIKNNTTRESWNGAPWLVKPGIADDYKIETDVPKHLQYGARVAEKKALKKADQEGHFGFFSSKKLPELKPATGVVSKTKLSSQELARNRAEQFIEYQRSLNGDPSFLVSKQQGGGPRLVKDSESDKKIMIPVVTMKAEPPPPPVIKYPIEDLDIKHDSGRKPRPKLRFDVDATPDLADDGDLLPHDIKSESVSHFLETWNTLNVYCEVFQLDSFTFDDFVEAVRFSSHDVDCELFVEVHCAVLKKLVNTEKDDDGAIQVSLPDLPQVSSDESDSEEEEESEDSPEPEPIVTRMTTRGSLAKAEAAHLKSQLENGGLSESGEPRVHRATELLEQYGWIERLRKRDFKNGGWQVVMVGLLYQLSMRPKMQKVCEEILEHLVPLDIEPTQESVYAQYATLDVNLRIRALQIICMLSLETKAIRNYLEECSNQMTEFRKEKMEHQRARKAALEELRKLHIERKAHEPEPEKEETEKEKEKSTNEGKSSVDVDMVDAALATKSEDDVDTDEIMDTEDEDRRGPSLRGGTDRILERKRRQEAERERREQLAKQPKGSKQYQRILKKIEEQEAKITELEAEIAIVDNDLREADCPRTRCLGKDRFCNRYWWFERNAMPYGGLPNSSTADAQYANGRLWVQGPDDMEREGFIDQPEHLRKIYVKAHRMTPAERKKYEEGETSLLTAHNWAYYDEPEQLDELIRWLDARGLREIKLKKELQLQRGHITKYMKARSDYLTRTAERAESEELPTKRMSTRTKTYVDDGRHRCLRWKNTTALSEMGHLHVDAGRAAKRSKRATDEVKELKAIGKQAKPLSRQGSRYKF
ncbi:DDT domain protein [Talaromyces proteolyticus]|uniref:DDT domain protein n=1 Tax=Talaromyces proteolyticus TaxID=1131652 RepID=A0AAD4KPY5_9EURO|nr:DDT domain protein [Talaromyces proteolyticus]KAH8696699.1 DDT domain protein [Talaromyces proteolyticus]